MRVLSVSATDRAGGAGIGAYRLHQSLQRAGVHSEMLVLYKVTADPAVHRLMPHLNRWGRSRRRLAERRHNQRLRTNPRRPEAGYWSLNQFSYPIAESINAFGADVVHLHWIGDNYLPIGEVAKISAPVVWTLRDMWSFTGGCHYAGDCGQYREGCGRCPQLAAGSVGDISAKVNREKRGAWSNLPLTIVCLSQWLADCARESAIFKDRRIEVIGNPIDPQVFKPLDRRVARRAFNLPSDKKLILFGAIGGTGDRRKGFRYLRDALRAIKSESGVDLVVFGGENEQDLGTDLLTHHIGRLEDEASLCLLYSACDIYVLPSVQDTFPKTVIEALASGTPCVTFDGSGPADLIRHQQNGYVARLRDVGDLLAGIEWVLSRSWSAEELHCDIIARYGERQIAARYLRVYRSLLGDAP